MNETRVAVVTGGSRGIGRAIVCALADLGLDLVVNYRADQAAANATVDLAHARGARRCLAIQADVSSIDDGARLVETAQREFGAIDILVNNAGIAPPQRLDLLDATQENWDRVLDTNLRGPYFLTQRVARIMCEQADAAADRDRQIHFVTSISAEFASIRRGEYCVSKAGLSMAAQLFALRLAPHGIRVFEIRPGVIDTDMTESVRDVYNQKFQQGLAPINRWGRPEDVAKVIAGIVAGHLPYATGNVVAVDGGLHMRAF